MSLKYEPASEPQVDKVLRGAFVAPGGSDARQLRGLLPSLSLLLLSLELSDTTVYEP